MSTEEIIIRLNALLDGAYSANEFENLLTTSIIFLIDVLQSLKGKEFCQGFLKDSIKTVETRREALVPLIRSRIN